MCVVMRGAHRRLDDSLHVQLGRVQLVAPEYSGVSNNALRWARRGALLDTPEYSGATN